MVDSNIVLKETERQWLAEVRKAEHIALLKEAHALPFEIEEALAEWGIK